MWLRANKILLNADKTELVLFRSKNRKITKNMNFRISGQKIKMLSKTKYLGLFLDENLSFKYLDTIKLKLNRANCLLSKIRHYVRASLLRTIYFTIFQPHLRYGCQIWGHNENYAVENIKQIQNKAIRILKLTSPRAEASNLYKESKIYTFMQITTIKNYQFLFDQIKKNLPKIFN